MGQDRLFVSNACVDRWLVEGRAEVDGDALTLRPEGARFALRPGVVFVAEVTGEGDPAGLVGTVRDEDQLAALGAEHDAGSVLLGDRAYDVVDGFVGAPVDPGAPAAGPSDGELDLLARFFLQASS